MHTNTDYMFVLLSISKAFLLVQKGNQAFRKIPDTAASKPL